MRGTNIKQFYLNKRVLILSSTGHKNVGVNGILLGTLKWLRPKNTKEIIITTFDKRETAKQLFPHKIELVSRRRVDIIWAFLRADTIIVAGNEIFNESFKKGFKLKSFKYKLIHSFEGTLPYLIACAAKLFGKSFIYLAVGTTSIPGFFQKRLGILSFNLCDQLIVRDKQSSNVLEKLKVHREIIVSNDLCFNLKPTSKRLGKVIAKQFRLTSKKFVLVALKKIENQKRNEQILNSVTQLLKELKEKGFSICFVPFSLHPYNPLENDLSMGEELKRKLGNENFILIKKLLTPQEALALISESKFVITMRLHCMILSIIAKTPFIGIQTNTKHKAVLESVNMAVSLLKEASKIELKKGLQKILK